MWRAAKVCFLYIGTVIGAGFASGREIALFFGDTAPLNVALAAAFMAIPEALFLTAGKLGVLPDNTAVRTGVFIAAFSSVAAMLAGCDLALYDVTGVVSLGVIAAILAGVLVVGGMEKSSSRTLCSSPCCLPCCSPSTSKAARPYSTVRIPLSSPFITRDSTCLWAEWSSPAKAEN